MIFHERKKYDKRIKFQTRPITVFTPKKKRKEKFQDSTDRKTIAALAAPKDYKDLPHKHIFSSHVDTEHGCDIRCESKVRANGKTNQVRALEKSLAFI